MVYDTHTTVQTAQDGDIILIGEEHRNPICADLADDVLAEIEPRTLAIEMPPGQTSRSAAMGKVVSYARDRSLPRINIDENRRGLHSLDCNYTRLLRVANEFKHPIDEEGDVPVESINHARKTIRDDFGQDAYDEMYTIRERAMAERLNEITDRFETPVVAAVGTFHILALRDMLETIDERREIGDQRIRNHENATAPRAAATP